MSDHIENNESKTMKSAFSSDKASSSGILFDKSEFSIYVNKVTRETYIFHTKPIPKDIARLEYDPGDHSVIVVKKDGTHMDLGAKVEWLVRPYFTAARQVGIVHTKDGEVVDGFMVPITHKPQK